jgi:hypothetical protein
MNWQMPSFRFSRETHRHNRQSNRRKKLRFFRGVLRSVAVSLLSIPGPRMPAPDVCEETTMDSRL